MSGVTTREPSSSTTHPRTGCSSAPADSAGLRRRAGGRGEAAVARSAGQLDLIVLDIGLPDIDGVEVCRRVRTFSDAYVLMLTAQDTELDKVVGFEAGADDYVTKPFSARSSSAA